MGERGVGQDLNNKQKTHEIINPLPLFKKKNGLSSPVAPTDDDDDDFKKKRVRREGSR